jgi:uncharacterized protein YdhG (YjbR/CyaY superfamily)
MLNHATVSAYIASAPRATQVILRKVRQVIKKAAPQATEVMSYGLATFDLNKKHAVHFGFFKNHIGFFPTPTAIEAFKQELTAYKTSKGTVQFQLDEPIPYDLIKKMTKFRVKEIADQASKTCSRGHVFVGKGPCPKCWPGRLKKEKLKVSK